MSHVCVYIHTHTFIYIYIHTGKNMHPPGTYNGPTAVPQFPNIWLLTKNPALKPPPLLPRPPRLRLSKVRGRRTRS